MDRQQLLKRLDKAWTELKHSYAGLTEAQLTEPGVAGAWSVRDILVHIAIWEEEALTHLPLILEGGRPPRYSVLYGGIDAFNRQSMDQRRDLSPADALHRLDATHERLIAYIVGLPDEQFTHETRVRRRIRLDTYGHYPEHTQAIRAWREQRFSGG